jgi:signal transduction histidine kinase
VSDEGPGLAPQVLAAIERGEDPPATAGGDGIGLALVFRLSLAFDIPVRITSKEHGGTMFRLQLISEPAPT